MAPPLFTKRALSYMGSNVAPLLILAAFVGLFVLSSPWETDPVIAATTLFLTAFPFVLLATLTLILRAKFVEDDRTGDDVLPP